MAAALALMHWYGELDAGDVKLVFAPVRWNGLTNRNTNTNAITATRSQGYMEHSGQPRCVAS
ncbi:hypothetical protein EMCG_08612 [[Emmonsia] crescens]|uniref:Uncharacterized protein n=1 Tax=[Emmonsia] crescens TaxID=73230 RepID=A0A0G2J443_9EURO|nr:hypothetical protein EMCG_08612 [Emmonsia crescens UAMH 3008]